MLSDLHTQLFLINTYLLQIMIISSLLLQNRPIKLSIIYAYLSHLKLCQINFYSSLINEKPLYLLAFIIKEALKLFSYDEYKTIIHLIQTSHKAENFDTARYKSQFIIMRHDVEFSVSRAYQLALLEAKESFYSTYFFQLTNNAYNLLSLQNRQMINEIAQLGHHVGLHFHLNGLTDLSIICSEIQKQIHILNEMFPFTINSFSIHRPTQAILKANLKFPNLINAYEDDFFSFVENMQLEVPTICYLSDARHQWNYGLFPSLELFKHYNKIQILTHPYSWTPQGFDNLNNFRTLLAEKSTEYIETINSECKHFKEIQNEL